MFKWHIATRPDDPTRGYLMVECERSHTGYCPRALWQRPAVHPMWHWDGDVERPTITPSIDCKGIGCTRHFTITKGVAA